MYIYINIHDDNPMFLDLIAPYRGKTSHVCVIRNPSIPYLATIRQSRPSLGEERAQFFFFFFFPSDLYLSNRFTPSLISLSFFSSNNIVAWRISTTPIFIYFSFFALVSYFRRNRRKLGHRSLVAGKKDRTGNFLSRLFFFSSFLLLSLSLSLFFPRHLQTIELSRIPVPTIFFSPSILIFCTVSASASPPFFLSLSPVLHYRPHAQFIDDRRT